MGLDRVNFGSKVNFGRETDSLKEMRAQTNVLKPRIIGEDITLDEIIIKVGTKKGKYQTVRCKWQEKDARPYIDITASANPGFEGPPPPDETGNIYLTNKDGSINNEVLKYMSREEVNLVLEEKKRLARYSDTNQIAVGAERALIMKNNAKPGEVLVAETWYKGKSYPVFKWKDGNYYIRVLKKQDLYVNEGLGGGKILAGGGEEKYFDIKINQSDIRWQGVKLPELKKSLSSRGTPRTGLQIEKPAEFGGLDYVSPTGEYALTTTGGTPVWRDEKEPNKYYTKEGGFLWDQVKRYPIDTGSIVKRAVRYDTSGPYYLWKDGTRMGIEESQVQAEPKK